MLGERGGISLPNITARFSSLTLSPKSTERMLHNLLQHEVATLDRNYLPFVAPLVDRLSQSGMIILVIDGRETGGYCMTIMIRNSLVAFL